MDESMADFAESWAKSMMWFFIVVAVIAGLALLFVEGVGILVFIFVIPFIILNFGIIAVIISIRRNIIEVNDSIRRLHKAISLNLPK